MKQRGVFPHRFFRWQNRGVFLILNLDCPQSPRRGNLIIGDHGGNVISMTPNSCVQEPPVHRVMVGGIRRPGMTRCGVGKIRHIKTGDDFYHAGDFFSFACINFFYQAVGDGRVQHFADKSVPVNQIIGIFGPAWNFFPGINSWYALPDTHTGLWIGSFLIFSFHGLLKLCYAICWKYIFPMLGNFPYFIAFTSPFAADTPDQL